MSVQLLPAVQPPYEEARTVLPAFFLSGKATLHARQPTAGFWWRLAVGMATRRT